MEREREEMQRYDDEYGRRSLMRTARAKSGVRQALLAGFRLRGTQSRPDIWGWAGQSGMDMYWRRMIESISARVFCLLDAPGIFYFSLRSLSVPFLETKNAARGSRAW